MSFGPAQDEGRGAPGRNWSRWSFVAFVVVPVTVIGLYFGLFASDQYLCESVLSVQDQSGPSQSIIERFGALTGSSNAASDLALVDEYIHSSAMLQILQEKHDLRGHFARPGIDMLSRLKRGAKWEDFLDYYNGKVTTQIESDKGFVHLSVRSFAPEYCRDLSRSILAEAERFVNTMSAKIQKDFLRFAADQLSKAEQEMVDARDALTAYQAAHHILDPEKSAETAIGIVGGLESEMAALQVDLADKLRVHNPSSPVIQAIKSRQKALQKQIVQENSRMTRAQESGAMTQNIAEYKTLVARIEFAKQRYEASLALWETAQAEALRKTRYIIPVSDPRVPEEALGLDRLREIFGWSVSILVGYMFAALLLLSIRDHMER